jgi:hypothetical protein
MTDNAKKIDDELSLLYSSCVSEIISFKSQQWHTTNYGILLYVAVISISKLMRPTGCVEWILLYALPVIILVAGLYMIHTLFDSIHTRRKRLTEIRKHASDNFMVAWGCGKPREQVVDDPDQKLKLSWFLYSIFVLGFLVTVWVLSGECQGS